MLVPAGDLGNMLPRLNAFPYLNYNIGKLREPCEDLIV